MRRRIALIAISVVVAGSCGADGDVLGGDSTEPVPTTPPPAATTAPQVTTVAPADGSTPPPAVPDPAQAVPEILAFTAQLVDGGSFDGADLAGRDVVFWFWAPWCTTCAAAASEVGAAADAAGSDVTFVGVGGLSSDGADMGRFVEQHGVGGFAQLADTDGALYTRFRIIQQHSFAFVTADGDVETVAAYGRDVDIAELIEQMFG
ncbi:MAG: redoxin domain-containing protein [Acidimicrobiia bacterium]